MMRWVLALTLSLACSGELAAQGKGIRFWNLTTATVSGLQLSPAGKNAWGPNQTANDKDGEVDHDERLRITGAGPLGRQAQLPRQAGMCRAQRRDKGGRRVLDRGQGLDRM